MYLRKVPRGKVNPDLERTLRCFEESGFAVDPHVYFAEPAGEESSRPMYARLRLLNRDMLLRLEESDDESGGIFANLVDLGEEGVGKRPVHIVLREAIYEDKFESAET